MKIEKVKPNFNVGDRLFVDTSSSLMKRFEVFSATIFTPFGNVYSTKSKIMLELAALVNDSLILTQGFSLSDLENIQVKLKRELLLADNDFPLKFSVLSFEGSLNYYSKNDLTLRLELKSKRKVKGEVEGNNKVIEFPRHLTHILLS